MSENSYRRACRTSELRPRCIFFAKTTLPHDADAGPRPYLAIKKINNQIIALPLTSLEKKVSPNETYEEICIRHRRSERDYYPIHPNRNTYYDSITQPPPSGGNSCSVGWIDLITPMTIGTKNIIKGKIVYEISQPDLDKVLKAYASRMGFHHLGLSNGCLGACARVPGMAQKIGNILNITKKLLQASEDKASTQGENERCFKEMIRICNDLDTTPPPSPPHEVISSSEIPADIDLLPARAASRRQRRRGAKSNGACNDAQLETRRTDDPNDKGGPNGGGPSGGEHYTSFPVENKTQAGMSTSDGSKTSAQSGGHVHCANQNPEGACTDEDWYRIEYEDQEDSETNSTEEIPGEPWQLVDYEVSYCGSESDSYASSSEPGGLDVEIWRESSVDRVQNPSSAAPTVMGQSQIPKEFIITRYLDGISDSRVQDSPDESPLTPSKTPIARCIISPPETNTLERAAISTTPASFGKSSLLDTVLGRPQKSTTTLGLMCPRCKQITNPRIPKGEPYIEAFCEKCNARVNQNWNEDVPNRYRVVRALEGVGKLVLKSPQTGSATWYSSLGLVERLFTQENRKERDFLAESCSESSPFRFVLREECFDEPKADNIGNYAVPNRYQLQLEQDYQQILRLLGASYANLSKDECGHESAGRQPGNTCQQFLDRNNSTKSSRSGWGNNQSQRLAFPTVQYTTAIQRRCDYLLRLINPAQKSLPPVHIIAKRLLQYVYSIKEISRAGRWKGVDCLETFRCGILPKEYLPANSDVLINLLRSYPLTDGDPDIQAIARLSLTNDSDLLLERINFALPRSHDDWLATDDVLDNGVAQSTPEKRLLLQQDGMIKWIRFLMSTLGIGEIHTREDMEREGSSKIEKDLLWLDSLVNPELPSESEREVKDIGQGRIRSIEDLEENILGEEDKKTKCENERYGRCMFEGEDRYVSVCVNNCNSEDRDRRQES